MHQLDDRRRRQSLVYVGGALSPARGELDDLVTSLVHAARSSHGSARGRRTWSSQTPCLVSSRCSCRDAGTPCIYGSRKSTRIVAGAARRRFAAASPHRSLVGRHPRRFRAASRPTSRAHRYPGAAPRSRPGASASGPLELSASVSVLICLIYSSCILPLHYKTTHRRAGASPRLASARPEPACPGRKQPQNPWGASARASGRAS